MPAEVKRSAVRNDNLKPFAPNLLAKPEMVLSGEQQNSMIDFGKETEGAAAVLNSTEAWYNSDAALRSCGVALIQSACDMSGGFFGP